MRVEEIQVVKRTERVLVYVSCNCCGAEIKPTEAGNYEGLLGVDLIGGYGSKMGDMVRATFDICEDCLIAWFESFKHSPYVEEVDHDGF